jgi:hypothetical protein
VFHPQITGLQYSNGLPEAQQRQMQGGATPQQYPSLYQLYCGPMYISHLLSKAASQSLDR